MTFEIALILGILAVSLILFVSEVIRMDLVALAQHLEANMDLDRLLAAAGAIGG